MNQNLPVVSNDNTNQNSQFLKSKNQVLIVSKMDFSNDIQTL